MDVGGTIGKVLGLLLAPPAALGSFLRGTRLVHARGVVYRAEVRADAAELALGALARRLVGPAIVRLSTGGSALGVAVRFRTTPAAAAAPGALVQDLVFLSVPHLWQIPIAARLTDEHDFLANTYFTIARSRVAGLGLVELRLVPQAPAGEVPAGSVATVDEERRERLDRATLAGTAVLHLELRPVVPGATWQALATLTLTGRAHLDAEALRFNPYHAALGIEPAGFLQGLRWATYPASQIGRALRRRLARSR